MKYTLICCSGVGLYHFLLEQTCCHLRLGNKASSTSLSILSTVPPEPVDAGSLFKWIAALVLFYVQRC